MRGRLAPGDLVIVGEPEARLDGADGGVRAGPGSGTGTDGPAASRRNLRRGGTTRRLLRQCGRTGSKGTTASGTSRRLARLLARRRVSEPSPESGTISRDLGTPTASTPRTTTAGPVVELRGLSRTYGSDPPVQALRGVDLTIHRGDWVAIVGPSGSGKSTLLNILGCLDRPTAGTYRIDGIDAGGARATTSAPALRARSIGFVFQTFHLLGHRTALENVMLAELYAGGERRGPARARPRRARAGRHGAPPRLPADQALRRRAAARGDRPGAARLAEPAALRRADRQPRLRQQRVGAGALRRARATTGSRSSSSPTTTSVAGHARRGRAHRGRRA